MSKHTKESEIILGIDPGSLFTGYAIIQVESDNEIKLVEMGTIHLKSFTTYERLHRIYTAIEKLIQKYSPTSFCIEIPFYGKNIQSMLKLGRAQGIAIAVAAKYDLPISEYSPRRVKQVVSGSGTTEKITLFNILKKQYGFKHTEKELDATDALSIALCHYYTTSSVFYSRPKIQKKNNSKAQWSTFLQSKEGRDRIK